jgi:hypothetical protein
VSAPSLLLAYRYLFGGLLLVGGLQALLAPAHAHAAALGAAEAAGALLLMVRGTQWLGAWLLLVVLSCASIAAALASELSTRFAVYAASAFLIVLLDRALRTERPAQ